MIAEACQQNGLSILLSILRAQTLDCLLFVSNQFQGVLLVLGERLWLRALSLSDLATCLAFVSTILVTC